MGELLGPPMFLGGLLALLVIAALVMSKRYWQAIGVAVVCITAPVVLSFVLLLLLPIDSDPIGLGVVFVQTFSALAIGAPLACAVVLSVLNLFRERRNEQRSIEPLD